MESITPVVQYVESHLEKCSSPENLTEGDMVSMLSGNGGSLVDVVLYVVPHRESASLLHECYLIINRSQTG